MAEISRISPAEARQKSSDGSALLVCAYESDELCRKNRLDEAVSLSEFTSRLSSLGKDREIIFYCA